MEQIDVGLENWVANLAARLQLDSPAPSRPPLVGSGASSSSADAALGQAPIQSAASLELLQELQRGLHQAGLQQGHENTASQNAASLEVLLQELQQRGIQQAGLPRAGSLSALGLPGGMPPPQQPELGSPGRSDTASLPSDIEGLAHAASPFTELKEGNEMDLGKLEADLDEFESEGRNEPIVKRSWTAAEDATRPARLSSPLPLLPEAYP